VRQMAVQQSRVTLVGGQQPAVQAAFGVRAEDLGGEEDKAGPGRQALRQRWPQLKVRVKHDVDAASDLVSQDIELHARGDVGEHLSFKDHGETGAGRDQHSVGLRRAFQPLTLVPGCLPQEGNEDALIKLAGQQATVTGWRGEARFEVQELLLAEGCFPAASESGGVSPRQERRISARTMTRSCAWNRRIKVAATQNRSSFPSAVPT
jgi:hypothetical protein